MQEGSLAINNQLPSIGHKKKVPTQQAVGLLLEDDLIKDQLNRQHNKVEQEIKKYDEILRRNKNIRQHYEHTKRKANMKVLQSNQNAHNLSSLLENSQVSASGKQLAGIGVYGVKLENKHLDVRRGGRPQNEGSVILNVDPRGANKNRLPALSKLPSQAKGLVSKQVKLR